MQRKAVNTLLLGIVAWNFCKVEMRLCAVVKDDRIVFPVDTSESTQRWNYFNISVSTKLPVNSTTLASDKMSPDSSSNSDSNSTKLELDKMSPDSDSNSTKLGLDKMSSDSKQDSEMDSNITMTTALPAIDNRILVDTLPICGPGFQLRAGRCRKAA